MQQQRAGAHAGSGDQAVERVPDDHALPASVPIETRCEREVVQTLEAQNRKGTQVLIERLRLVVGADALQQLDEDDIGEGNGLAPLDGVSFTTAGALLLAASIIAALIPANRAAGLDPLRSLRVE